MRRGGWASSGWPAAERLSYLPTAPDDDEPATAICDAWAPPSPMALPRDLCARLRAAATAVEPLYGPNGCYYLPELDAADRQQVCDRFDAANQDWWRLDIDRWDVMVKHYRPGEQHPPHTDWHPAGGARRKLAGSVQLSAPQEYGGGRLVVTFAHHRVPMPSDLGTLVAFPGWTVHEVEPITRGERWALIVNGYGPPLR